MYVASILTFKIGIFGVKVIVSGNRISNPSSNTGKKLLEFLALIGKSQVDE